MKTIKMCTLRYDYISHGEFLDLIVTFFIICIHLDKSIFVPALFDTKLDVDVI